MILIFFYFWKLVLIFEYLQWRFCYHTICLWHEAKKMLIETWNWPDLLCIWSFLVVSQGALRLYLSSGIISSNSIINIYLVFISSFFIIRYRSFNFFFIFMHSFCFIYFILFCFRSLVMNSVFIVYHLIQGEEETWRRGKRRSVTK